MSECLRKWFLSDLVSISRDGLLNSPSDVNLWILFPSTWVCKKVLIALSPMHLPSTQTLLSIAVPKIPSRKIYMPDLPLSGAANDLTLSARGEFSSTGIEWLFSFEI